MELAVPQLPMMNLDETRAFYERLGFICAHWHGPPDTFLIMIKGGLHLQFFEMSAFDPDANAAGCYLYVNDVDETYAEFTRAGVGRLMPIEMKPWGFREFALVDLNGNLMRVASPKLQME